MLDARRARASLAGIISNRPDDADRIADARRKLAEANIHNAIQKNLDAAPPLRPEQLAALVNLLHGVR